MADSIQGPEHPIELPNFRIKRLLDRGGMGAVYLAEQQNPVREVAIKIIAPDHLPNADPEMLEPVLEMLRHEGNIAARFNHESLITVHECGVLDGHYYLAMEYLPGGSLRERIGSGLEPVEAASIVRNIAEGLSEMHAAGVLHRDIKPENVLFRKNGTPVLMDYGIAKDAGTIGKLTQLGLSTGTPEYMSPEQVDDGPTDTRSDLYALGVLFYELLTGEVPFNGRSAMAVAYAHVNHPVPPLSDGLEHYQGLLDRLLAKDPADRFQSAEELIKVLDPNRMPTRAPTRVTPAAGGARPKVTMIGELRRRKVLHTAGFYGVTAFGVSEILTFVFDNFGVPLWANRLVAALFVAGFPIAMFLSWAFDIEPGGRIRRTRFSGQSTKPIVAATLTILLAATAGLFYLIVPRDGPRRPAAPGLERSSIYQPKPGAYEQVILGRQQYGLRTAESLLAAEQHFQKAVEIDPDYALAYVGLADTYAWLPDYVEEPGKDYWVIGEQMLEKALELDPRSGEAYAARARYHGADESEAVEADYLRAVELSPEQAYVRYEYGTFLMGQGRLEDAVEQRRIAAELDPMTPLYHWGVASMMAEAGRIEGALAQLRANIKRFPDFQLNYERIGGILVSLGRLGEAQLYTRRFRMRNPRVAENWADECEGYLHLGDPDSAGACLGQFAEAHPDHFEYHSTRAFLHIYRGELGEALAVRQMLWERDPDDPFRISQLAELLDWQGEFETARRLMADAFPRMLENGLQLPDSRVIVIRAAIFASILHDSGQIERRDALIGAIESTISQMEPWSYGIVQVMVHAMRGDYERAIAALEGATDAGWKRFWWMHGRNQFLARQGLLAHPDYIALMDRMKTVIDEQRHWFDDNKDKLVR